MASARVLPPPFGLGTFNNFKDSDKVAAAVTEAIKCGYRHFDLAPMYENQAAIGAAIEQAIKDKLVKRAELFITTKLWNTHHAPEDVEDALKSSLKELKLESVDCFMMHWPVQFTKDSARTAEGFKFEIVHKCDTEAILRTWSAMEAMVEKGLTRSLGVSNFDASLIGELVDSARIKPTVVSMEMHPMLPQHDLLELCQNKNLHVIAYSPLGKNGVRESEDPDLLRDPRIIEISKNLGKTPAQVALRWGVQRGTSVIPQSTDPAHIASNADILNWSLTPSEMKILDKPTMEFRFVRPAWFDFESDGLTTRNRSRSHPELIQPLLKYGHIDDKGVYHNSFSRDGKPLTSEIYMKRGVIAKLEKYARDLIPEKSLTAKNFVITDEIVDDLMDVSKTFVDAMRRAGIDCEKIVVPADKADDSGETSVEPYKTGDVFHNCIAEILALGPNKHSCIISVGGGVVNNLCGVLAGMIYRGIGLVHFTTTTMGMLDAALDFKQAINHDLGKNLLGCYYPASKVVIDPDCTASLSTRHVRNGIAEALKHAICQSEEMVNEIVQPVIALGERVMHNGEYIEKICKHCIEIKAPTLDHYNSSDFNEMCPQYGHAVGHAVESISWDKPHEPLLHGEAVAIGMCVSAEIAFLRGLCDQECVDKHYYSVLGTGLPAFVPEGITTEAVLKKMMYDKHYVKSPSMGLTAKVGEMAVNFENNRSFAFQVTNEELLRAIEINRGKSKTVQAPACNLKSTEALEAGVSF